VQISNYTNNRVKRFEIYIIVYLYSLHCYVIISKHTGGKLGGILI
jgi:hypothetical protein